MDDGCGIRSVDLGLVVTHFATSKLKQLKDFDSIVPLAFEEKLSPVSVLSVHFRYVHRYLKTVLGMYKTTTMAFLYSVWEKVKPRHKVSEQP
jgi:hypothetical protein